MNEQSKINGSTTFDLEQIKEMIPHRYPFLMIEKVVNVVIQPNHPA